MIFLTGQRLTAARVIKYVPSTGHYRPVSTKNNILVLTANLPVVSYSRRAGRLSEE
jgi:hypothetical protein